jgi:FkbM family methyltransferase
MQQSKLGNFIVNYNNSQEFHELKTEIFTQDGYYFEVSDERLEQPEPIRIIDAGAHIGLATLYFKKLYPAAQVVAIEPHPANFQLLEKNVWENDLAEVELRQAALSTQPGRMELHSDTQFGWFSSASVHPGAWNGDQQTQPLLVNCQPLTDFLQQPVDFMKMDIEGSEQKVLLAAGDQINNVKHMMIEFHPTPDQNKFTVVDFLERHGYQVSLWKKGKPVKITQVRGMFMIEAKK